MKLVIINYNAGNTRSLFYALQRLGVEPLITDDPQEILSADKVIFPGVGEASTAMNYLRERNLDQVIRDIKQPMLGICLGMQLMCSFSEENNTDCLGIFDQKVLKFPPEDKVPHMGWNEIRSFSSPLLNGINEGEHVYFVHSFYVEQGADTSATCDYIVPFSAGIRKNNFHAFQFHPEKSGPIGSQILSNFIEL